MSSPRQVTVTADGATTSVTATGTVADALGAAGVTLDTVLQPYDASPTRPPLP